MGEGEGECVKRTYLEALILCALVGAAVAIVAAKELP